MAYHSSLSCNDRRYPQGCGTCKRPGALVALAGLVASAMAMPALAAPDRELLEPAWKARKPLLNADDIWAEGWLFRPAHTRSASGFQDGPLTAHWSLPISGNWTDATRWDTPHAPNNGTPPGTIYNAVIDAFGPAYTVTLNSNINIGSLTLESNTATLRHTGGALAFDQFDLKSGQYRMEGGTLQGGVLNLLGGDFWMQSSIANRLSGMTINGDLTTTGGTRILDGLTLNGTWRLNAGPFSGFLAFEGTQTLHSGTIIFEGTNGQERRLYIEPDSTVTLASGTAIRGGYAIIGESLFPGLDPRGIINHGLISADMAGRDITVVEGAKFENHGMIEAIDGGRLSVHTLHGNVNSARAMGAGSVLTLGGAYTNNLSLDVSDGATLALNGLWVNQGSINLSGGSFLHLGGEFSSAALGTINRGDGTIRLTGQFNNTNSVLTLNAGTGPWQLAGGTILGGTVNLDGVSMDTWGTDIGTLVNVSLNGTVNVNSGGHLRMRGDWQNNGTININDGTLDLGGLFNSASMGTIVRTPATGGLVMLTGAMDNKGGVLNLDNTTGPWRLRGSIQGGTINTSGAGRLDVEGQIAALTDVTMNGEMTLFSNARLEGAGLQNTGLITVNQNARLRLSEGWSNSGTINLSRGNLDLFGEFTRADVGIVNHTGIGSSTIEVQGKLDNTGSSIAVTPSLRWQLHNGTITGGTITTAPNTRLVAGISTTPLQTSLNRLQGVVVNGEISILESVTTLAVSNDTVLNGLISVNNGRIAFEGDYTFGGTLFGQATNGRATVQPGRTLTLAPGALVFGRGLTIGAASGPGSPTSLVNMGTIRADHSSAPVTLAAGTTTNLGILEVRDGGRLQIDNLVGNVNTASAQGQNSTLVLDGSYTNNQTLTVSDGAVLDLRGNWNNTGSIIANNSTVQLGGNFSMSTAGNFQRTGGTVRLTGALNNSNSVLTLNSTTGSWDLHGGTISGGTVDLLDGTLLRTTGTTPSRLSGAVINGPVELAGGELRMASGASLAGNTLLSGGTLTYEGSSTISGGTYLFDSSSFGQIRIETGAQPGTLTIGPGATIRGGNGFLGSVVTLPDDDTIINQGLISADIPGREIRIRSNEFINEGILEARNGGIIGLGQPGAVFSWSNTGLIRLIDSTLRLGGTFSVGALGNFEQTNSSVDITGILQNQGSVLNLSAATGSWNLRSTSNQPSPRIVGGTITTDGGVRLGVHGTGTSILDNVTINGGLDVQSVLRLENGTTIPQDVHFHGGQLFLPSGTVMENANYVFNGARTSGGPQVTSRLRIDPVGTTALLTIGSTSTLSGHGGRLGDTGGLNDTIINHGLISANVVPVPADSGLHIQPRTFVNDGTLETRNGGLLSIGAPYTTSVVTTWSNTGIIRALDGPITLGGRTTTADLGTIERSATGIVRFQGELINTDATLVVDANRDFSNISGRIIGGTLIGPVGRTLPISGELVGVQQLSGAFNLSGRFMGGLNLDGTATITNILIGTGNQTISGGTYNLSGGQIRTQTNETLTLAPSAVVTGAGTLASRDSTSGGPNELLNFGTIRATVPGQNLTISASNFTNHGLLEAVNGSLSFHHLTNWVHRGDLRVADGGLALLGGTFSVIGGSLLNDGGTIRITGQLNNQNSTLTVGGSMGDIELRGTIAGGTVESTGQGRLLVAAGAGGGRLDGVTLNSNLHATSGMYIANGLQGTGTISTGGNASALSITVEGTNSTFHGGNFVLSGPAASTPHRMTLVLPPSTLTLGAGASIRGGHATLLDHAAPGGTLISHGLISADQQGKMLTIAPDTFQNLGVVEAINGGILNIAGPAPSLNAPSRLRSWSGAGTVRVIDSTLRLGGIFPTSALNNFHRDGGIVELHGTVDNRNAVLTLDGAANSWVMIQSGLSNLNEWTGTRILGGTVNLLNGAQLTIPALGGLTLDGATLNGSLDVHGRLFTSPGTTVSGPITLQQGAIMRLFDPQFGPMTLPTNEIIFAGTHAPAPSVEGNNFTIPASVLVRGGSGVVRATGGNAQMRNYGRISADTPDAPISVSGHSWINHGVVEAINGGHLALGGSFSSPGTIRLTDGQVTIASQFTTAGFGGFDRTGGIVRFTGFINNTDSVLNLDGFDWIMDNAYLKHGSLNLTGGASLLVQGQPTTLDAATVSGTINLLQNDAQLTIRNGLSLTSGGINLAAPGSTLHFIGHDSLLSGGTVVFDPASGGGDRKITGMNGAVMTLAPATTVRGGRGTMKTSETSTIINKGKISADVNNETITIYTARFQNEGILEAINGGSLEFIPPDSGPFQMDLINMGLFSPGPRTLAVDGFFTQTETGTFRASVEHLDGSLAYTRLMISGEVDLNGTLELVLAGGLQPWPGMQLHILDIDFSQLTGGFSTLDLPSLATGFSWDASSLYTSGHIGVVPAPGATMLIAAGLLFMVPRRRRQEEVR